MRFTKHKLAITILDVFTEDKKRQKNKINIIGRSFQNGSLEYKLGVTFTNEERALAADVFAELARRKLIIPTYSHVMSPEDWFIITELGELSLKTGVMDNLDKLLSDLDSEYDLLGMRRGMYEAMLTQQTDWQRHVAASATELITKKYYMQLLLMN